MGESRNHQKQRKGKITGKGTEKHNMNLGSEKRQ